MIGKAEVLWRENVPTLLSPLQIPHSLPWDRTWAPGVKIQKIKAMKYA